MENFTTKQLNELHNRFKDIFKTQKNISKEFQKLHFQITAELLKRKLGVKCLKK